MNRRQRGNVARDSIKGHKETGRDVKNFLRKIDAEPKRPKQRSDK